MTHFSTDLCRRISRAVASSPPPPMYTCTKQVPKAKKKRASDNKPYVNAIHVSKTRVLKAATATASLRTSCRKNRHSFPPPVWLVKTRRAPSRHSRDARVYGHTTTAMHKLSTHPVTTQKEFFIRYSGGGKQQIQSNQRSSKAILQPAYPRPGGGVYNQRGGPCRGHGRGGLGQPGSPASDPGATASRGVRASRGR